METRATAANYNTQSNTQPPIQHNSDSLGLGHSDDSEYPSDLDSTVDIGPDQRFGAVTDIEVQQLWANQQDIDFGIQIVGEPTLNATLKELLVATSRKLIHLTAKVNQFERKVNALPESIVTRVLNQEILYRQLSERVEDLNQRLTAIEESSESPRANHQRIKNLRRQLNRINYDRHKEFKELRRQLQEFEERTSWV